MQNLPVYTKKYFWDSDFNKLNLKEYENFILGRLMLYGDVKSIRFILKSYTRKKVESYFIKKGKFVLDRKSYNFWKILIDENTLWKK
ncbi:MAG: hypothetical protein R6W90_15485 [Ignavibacteriaceae bacterium]